MHDAANWDSQTLPTAADDVVIDIPHSVDGGTSVCSLSDGYKLTVGSLAVTGPVQIAIESALSANSLTLNKGAALRLSSATISANALTVKSGAQLSMDNAEVKGNGNTLRLNVESGGNLFIGGDSGADGGVSSSRFTGAQLSLSGNGLWTGGPLIFDSADLTIEPSGVFSAGGDNMNTGNAASRTQIINRGTLVFNSSTLSSSSGSLQLVGLNLVSGAGSKIRVTGDAQQSDNLLPLRILTNINCAETGSSWTVDAGRQLVFGAANHTIGAGCSVVASTGASVLFDSGFTRVDGHLAGNGTFVNHATVLVNGNLDSTWCAGSEECTALTRLGHRSCRELTVLEWYNQWCKTSKAVCYTSVTLRSMSRAARKSCSDSHLVLSELCV